MSTTRPTSATSRASATSKRAATPCTSATTRAWRTSWGRSGSSSTVVLWNTSYINAALEQRRAQGVPVLNEDIARLSPFVRHHLNVHGKYSFLLPESAGCGCWEILMPPTRSDAHSAGRSDRGRVRDGSQPPTRSRWMQPRRQARGVYHRLAPVRPALAHQALGAAPMLGSRFPAVVSDASRGVRVRRLQEIAVATTWLTAARPEVPSDWPAFGLRPSIPCGEAIQVRDDLEMPQRLVVMPSRESSA